MSLPFKWHNPGCPCCTGGEHEIHQSYYRYEIVSKTVADRELYLWKDPTVGGTVVTPASHAVAFANRRYYGKTTLANAFKTRDAIVMWSRDALDKATTGDVLDTAQTWTVIHQQYATSADRTLSGLFTVDVSENDQLVRWINSEYSYAAGRVIAAHLWESDLDGGSPALIRTFPIGDYANPTWYPVFVHMNTETSKVYFYELYGEYRAGVNSRWVEYDLGSPYAGAATYFLTGDAWENSTLDREHNQIYASAPIVAAPPYADLYRIDLAAKTKHKILSGTNVSPKLSGMAAAWSDLLGKVAVYTTGDVAPDEDHIQGLFLVDYDDSGSEYSLPYSALEVDWTELSPNDAFTLGRGYERFGTTRKQTTNCCGLS